ncbi:MAG TPA: HlyD family efflux transporter periplasmic adaptor subunit, partial [Vicinamibacterales bacterium]|nr:HlyD family efflux transporter periplasmic adaptor subunit [Vicinamibacterales bacterium]
GDIVRDVRGAGQLVPEDVRQITTTANGRVEKIVLRPGAEVKPGTVILELSNPDLKQQVDDAELAYKAAQAQLSNARANLKINRTQLDNAVNNAQVAFDLATTDLEANRTLASQGIVAPQVVKQKEANVNSAKNALDLAKKQRDSAIETENDQLAPQQASVSQAKARFDQLARQLDGLHVRSDMSGLLQAVSVERGQQVGPGTNLARVSDPTRLKAEIRISETQTRDLAIGQSARIDTRNGIVTGHVTRIDPASTGGTVGVDVTIDEKLPPGARPDQSVDGVVELQRMLNVLYVESPTFGQENASITLFKMQGPSEAVRTTVKLGRRTVQYVEVLGGLNEGDRVILADMSAYDSHSRVRLN